MLRRQPEKLLLNAAEVAAITNSAAAGESAIAVIPNFGEIQCSQLVSWNTQCTNAGTPAIDLICFEALGDSCECPSCISVELVILPDLTLYTTDETFEVRRIYEYCSPNGGPIDLDLAVADIADQINNDLYFTGTAVAEGSGDTPETKCDAACATGTYVANIEITGHAGQDFETFTVDAKCVETTQAFVRPYLTETDLKRLFPILPGSFGASPERDKIACGIDYCVDIAVIKHEDVQDIDSTNVENYLEEVYIYSPANGGGTSSELKDALDAFIDGADWFDGSADQCKSV